MAWESWITITVRLAVKVESWNLKMQQMVWPGGMKIGANGNLFLQFSGNGIQEINPTDGSIVHEYEKGSSTDYMGVTSEYLIIVSAGEVYYYDVAWPPVNLPRVVMFLRNS